MALSAGETGHLADHAEHPQYVKHGATASTARPTLGSGGTAATVCLWDGSVDPDNKVSGDYWWDTANDLWKRYDGSAWVAASGTYRWAAPYYYGPFGAGTATLTVSANVVYYVPVEIGGSIDRLGIEVTTGITSNIDLGVYAMGSDGLPGSRVGKLGSTLSGASTGAVEGTVSISPKLGWGFFAFVADAGVGVRAVTAHVRGAGRASITQLTRGGYFESSSTLPATAVVGGTSNNMPFVLARAS